MGPLSLTSSMSSVVRYTRQGVHWLRLDSQKVKWPTTCSSSCKPFEPPLATFTSVCLALIPTWTVPQARLFLYFTRTLTHLVDTDVISCLFLRLDFPSEDTTLIMALVIHCFLFLSGTFMNIGYICCNPHISHLVPAFVPSCSSISWHHGIICKSGLYSSVTITKFGWKRIKYNQKYHSVALWFYAALSHGCGTQIIILMLLLWPVKHWLLIRQ